METEYSWFWSLMETEFFFFGLLSFAWCSGGGCLDMFLFIVAYFFGVMFDRPPKLASLSIHTLSLERTRGGWRSSSLKLLMLDPCLATASFLNELKCMQRSLFIVQGILGVKRVKIGVFHQKGLTNQHSLV